jgi:uncharacterized protein with HEPN domain
MSRDREAFLDILQAAELALEDVTGKSMDEFLEDTQCQGDVCWRLSIIGEAARRLSDEARESFPGIPWSKIMGMRNRLIHNYNGIDLVLVWDTVRSKLPELVAALEKLFPPKSGNS